MMPHNRRGTGTALVERQEQSIELLQKILLKLEEIRVILAKEKDK